MPGSAKVTILLAALAVSVASPASADPRAAAGWVLESLLPRSTMHGLQGLVVGPDRALYAADLTGRTIHRIDPRTGRVTDVVPAPQGSADDLAFAPDGTLAWTGGADGLSLMSRAPSGEITTLVGNTPGLNAVRFTADGRLFFTRVFGGDGLYEADRAHPGTFRTVGEKLGGLNAFDFEPDGGIVGPLFLGGRLVAVNPADGAMQTIADGFRLPSAVRRLPDGDLLALEYWAGTVTRIDRRSGARTLLATLPAPVDNLAIAGDRFAYVTSTHWNGITELDLRSGAQRRVTWSELTSPGALSIATLEGRETLLVADQWGARALDTRTRAITHLPLGQAGTTMIALLAIGDEWLMVKAGLARGVSRMPRAGNAPPVAVPGFVAPYGAAAAGDEVVVTDFGSGRLLRLAMREPSAPVTLADGLGGPVGVAADGAGGWYVAEFTGGRIVHVAAGAAPRVIASGLAQPEGLAVAADGHLFVAETGARRLLEIDPATGRQAVIARDLRIGLQPTGRRDDPFLPTGVAVSADGAIWVSGDVENEIYRLHRRDGARR